MFSIRQGSGICGTPGSWQDRTYGKVAGSAGRTLPQGTLLLCSTLYPQYRGVGKARSPVTGTERPRLKKKPIPFRQPIHSELAGCKIGTPKPVCDILRKQYESSV
jgi:hypothetical protein